MFSLMQHKNSDRLYHQAAHLAEAYEDLRKSYISACLVKALWTPDLTAYLHEEGNNSPTTKEEMNELLERMAQVGHDLGNLHSHVEELCADLKRVGRGESFSV